MATLWVVFVFVEKRMAGYVPVAPPFYHNSRRFLNERKCFNRKQNFAR